jgi:hypothetical protein
MLTAMPIKSEKNQSKNGLEMELDDRSLNRELELMGEIYARYLSIPLTSATELSDNAVEQYTKELSIVNNILDSGSSSEPLLISNIHEKIRSKISPKIGQRRLPEFFRSDGIAHTHRLISITNGFDVLKEGDFDIYLQLEIAQCKALLTYRKQLEEKIKSLSSNVNEGLAIKAFNWTSDKSKIQKLFRLLSDGGIIECSQHTFCNCFGNNPIDASTPKIKWLLTSKNGDVSKVSLFYFLYLLRENKLVTSPHQNHQNKTIERLFADAKGNSLKNLKQSKANSAKGADRELIAEIIRSIS